MCRSNLYVLLPTLLRSSSDREYQNNILLRIFGRVLELLMSLLLLIAILLAKPIPNPNSQIWIRIRVKNNKCDSTLTVTHNKKGIYLVLLVLLRL